MQANLPERRRAAESDIEGRIGQIEAQIAETCPIARDGIRGENADQMPMGGMDF